MLDKVGIYFILFFVLSGSFVLFKFLSLTISKDRPLVRLKYSLLATNSLLYLVIGFGGSTIIGQWQEIDELKLKEEIREDEKLLKRPSPLFKNHTPFDHHPGNPLPEIFLRDRPKEIWL